MEEAGFSFTKTIYQEDKSSGLLTIRMPIGSSVTEFYDLVTTTISRFAEGGSTTQHPDAMGKDEKVERCTGWILGKRSGDQPCVWIYGPEYLKWKLNTVYVEHFASAPFFEEIEHAKQWPATTAPGAEEARESDYWHPFTGEVVLKPHPGGKLKSNGEPLMVIKAWVGYNSSPAPEPIVDTRPAIRTKVSTFSEGLDNSDALLEMEPGDIKAVDIIAFVESWISVCHNPGETDAIISFISTITEQRYIRANTGFALLSRANGETVA